MSNIFDDLFDDFDFKKTDKPSSQTKTQASSDNSSDWFTSVVNTKKPATNASSTKQNDIEDDSDFEERLNRTGASTASYMPRSGGTATWNSTNFGTMNSGNFTQGQDTIQRIVNQPRPPTASSTREYDILDPPPKSSNMGDTEKVKKAVRFGDSETARPSTAPSTAEKTQNRPNTSLLSSLRTGLEPNKSSETLFGSKATTGSNKDDDWLGLKDNSDDDDDIPTRQKPKADTTISKLASKTPIRPAQEPPAAVQEPPKKSVLDSLLDDDRRALSEKTPISPKAPASKATPEFLFDDRSTQNKRPSTAETPRSIFFTDTTETKASTKTSIDLKTDFGDDIFKNASKDLSSSIGARPNNTTANYELKRLEFENNELKMTLEHMKRQHEVEITMLEEGYKHRLEYVEKSCERRESRLKEENEHLIRQLHDRTQQYENEKSSFLLDHQRRLDELQRDRTTELENLRTLQRQTLDHLRREHEQTIQRLKQLKQEEISTALDVTTHTRAFESVVDHMEQNARQIDELRLKVEAKHSSVVTDKEIEARAKEQQLKAYEERLHMQAADFDRERKNLQELVSRLEVHLSEQTKLVEEERWKALQAQKRMEAMQDALNGEQRLFMEKLARERAEIQRSKDQLLEDQKVALASIYENRSQLADERAKVEALQKAFQEQKHRDMLQNATMEAETRAQQKLVAEQITRLEKREQEIIKREEAFILERRTLSELKQHLESEQANLKLQQEEIKQKLIEIEHANELIKREKERLSQLYLEIHAIDGKNTGRLQQIQKSINTLRLQEEQINEKYSRMSNERENLKHLRSNAAYKNPTPIMDSGFSTLQLAGAVPILPTNSSSPLIDENAILRSLRMNALQDQLYIQDEMSFLHNIRSGNHLSARSSSLSNLHRNAESNLLRTNQ